MIEFNCGCGWQLAVEPNLAGKSVRCPGCHTVVKVPPPPAPVAVRADRAPAPSGPWKGIAGAASATALVAMVLLVAGRGGAAPAAPVPSEDRTGEITKLQADLAARDKELSALREQASNAGDGSAAAEERRAIEEERDRLARDLETLKGETEALRNRLARVEAPKAAPVPDEEPRKAAAGSMSIADVVDKCSPVVLVVRTQNGFGAGFFITPEGLAVTNYHVIARSSGCTVSRFEGKGKERVKRDIPARVVAVDLKNDLALLKVDTKELVPVADMEESGALRVGDEVIAIGNPALGSMMLDFSVSNGIVSNLERVVDGTTYIQTTASINPGNSGGPLFNRAGKVVGVVSAKGVNVENIGFAIPLSAVKSLYDRRETIYAVPGNLAEWENAQGFKFTHDTSLGIPVESSLTKIVLDAERDRILGLDFQNNGLAVISISKRKVLRNVFTGSDPTDFQMTSNPDTVWVSHIASKSVVKVDVADGRVLDKIEMPHRYESFVMTRNHIWTYGGTNLVVSLKDKKGAIASMNWSALAYDRRRDRMLALTGSSRGFGLAEFDPDKVAPILRDLAQARTARGPQAHKEVQELQNELDRNLKLHVLPSDTGAHFASWGAHTLTADGSSRVYVNRMAIRSDKLDTVVGFLKANPYSRSMEPGISQLLRQFPRLDRILAGSPDAKWIATGTHIYSGDRFTVHKELPVPAMAMAFTADSKHLYIMDVVNKMLLPIEVEAKEKDLK